MGTIFNSIVKLGVVPSLDKTEQRKVEMVNSGFIAGASFIGIYALVYYFAGPRFSNEMFVALFIFFAFFTVPLSNYFCKYTTARVLLLMFSNLSLIAQTVLGQGGYFHIHNFFLMFALIPVLIFPKREKFLKIAMTLLPSILFILVEVLDFGHKIEYEQLPNFITIFFRVGFAVGCIASLVMVIYYSEHVSASNEALLTEALNAAISESLTDTLTELPNRRQFSRDTELELHRSKREGTPLGLFFIDIDYFKRFNDSYGHPAGDECLKKVASAIRSALFRKSDRAYRYGGEEFVVLISPAEPTQVKIVAERILEAVQLLGIEHHESPYNKVTISMGVSVCSVDADIESTQTILRKADIALYSAKEEGRNRIKYFEETVNVDEVKSI